MNNSLIVLVLGSLFLTISACGSKVTTVEDDGCYRIENEEVIYTCRNHTAEESRASTPGYAGPYDPKALNLYRPGRFEDANSPVW